MNHTNVKTYLTNQLYHQWRQVQPAYSQQALITPKITSYIKGDLQPDNMPYFTTLHKGTPCRQVTIRIPFGLKKALVEKLRKDYIPVAGFLRSIIQLIIQENEQ